MPKLAVDFSNFKTAPRWSELKQDDYVIVDKSGVALSAAARFKNDVPTWNLYWALADRRDPDSESIPVELVRLPQYADGRIHLIPGYGKTSNLGVSWTLAAWMCKLPPEQYMKAFWPRIQRSLKLPAEHTHLFSS